MNRFPPSYDPKLYTISAVIIGLALTDNFTANEQDAIGNWFMTIGQTLENCGSWQEVVEERIKGNTININSQQAKNGGSPYMGNPPLYSSSSSFSHYKNDDDYFEALERTIAIMQEEIEKLKSK